MPQSGLLQAGVRIISTKKQLRSHYRLLRDAMAPEQTTLRSGLISEHIRNWELYQKADRILFYYPLGNEVSLLSVMEDALAAGKHVAFPKVSGDSMDFYEVPDPGQLREGSFHVMEPVVRNGQEPVRWEYCLCFVPGVAFDRSGTRFGYGKGFYDKYFAGKSGILLTGCAYECQIAETLPAEEWDRRMDALACESGIFKTIPELYSIKVRQINTARSIRGYLCEEEKNGQQPKG